MTLKFSNDIASIIIKYMLGKDYQVFTDPKEYNIIYLEGVSEDWTLNSDDPNKFNDRRLVIEVAEGVPKIVDHWQATTEPGRHYTLNPMNPGGAARIKFGQYKSWAVGMHGNSEPHEALIQVAPVTVHRDFNKDFKRTGDKLDIGLFGINQHWGYDAPTNDIKNASAGCLVGQMRKGHREFMAIVKQDRRYTASRDYVFYTTVIAGDDLLK
ncbi:peptidoglycan binding domain-containing protein [Nostoc sp. NIES-4103]|nr:peptidoglycan binding domain-containing protein [Nostoc sp. NIES-4103]